MSSKNLEICWEKKYIKPPIIDRARTTQIKFASDLGSLILFSRKLVTGNKRIDSNMENINGTTTV
jgi:hypothetical protein